MPKHSRKPKKNKDLEKPAQDDLQTVQRCWDAYERFVMLGAIALGLLQLIALKFPQAVWERTDFYLRTRSRSLPSERTVKAVMARILVSNLFIVAPVAIMREIRKRYLGGKIANRDGVPPELAN